LIQGLKKYLLLIFTGLLFFGCKKYPENTLWSNHPEKFFKGGKITSYKVNGADRMPYYRELYKTFPYNLYGQSVPDIFDLPFDYNAGSEAFTSDYGKGTLHFSKTKREVVISFRPANFEYGAENIFVHTISYKIMMLNKSGQMKLKGNYNSQVYEIEFNN